MSHSGTDNNFKGTSLSNVFDIWNLYILVVISHECSGKKASEILREDLQWEELEIKSFTWPTDEHILNKYSFHYMKP